MGLAFDTSYTERIFSLFERLNTKDKYEGSGNRPGHHEEDHRQAQRQHLGPERRREKVPVSALLFPFGKASVMICPFLNRMTEIYNYLLIFISLFYKMFNTGYFIKYERIKHCITHHRAGQRIHRRAILQLFLLR
jgi:hypothetical protein